MIFKEYIDKCTWDELKTTQGAREYMQHSLAELKRMEPKYTDDTPRFSIHFRENTPDEEDIDVNEHREKQRKNDDEIYPKYEVFVRPKSCENGMIYVVLNSWDEMLALEVKTGKGQTLSDNEIIISVIWELTRMEVIAFELRSLPPSSLKFNSYEELCRYCAVFENFTDETKTNDILAIIEAAEQYFPARLNELAREMGFPKIDNCMVNIPKVDSSSKQDVLGLSYVGWNKVELSIKLLGYDEKVREAVFNHQLRCVANVAGNGVWKKALLKYLVKSSSEPDRFTCNKRLITLLERFYDDENGSRII